MRCSWANEQIDTFYIEIRQIPNCNDNEREENGIKKINKYVTYSESFTLPLALSLTRFCVTLDLFQFIC